MQPVKDYLAMRPVDSGDRLDVGVKGMRWGVRRSREERAAAAGKSEGSTKTASKSTEPAATSGSSHKAPYEGETSSARYSRLEAQAKSGKAHEMSEPDLKFFNSRTDAINKVNKMYEAKPNWVAEAAKTAGKQAVQQTMSNVAKGVAEKYVSGPMLNALTGGKGEEVKALGDVAKAVATPIATAVKQSSATTTSPSGVTTTAPRPPGMTRSQSLDYLRSHASSSKAKPSGYSPSGNYDLFKQLREEGVID